MIQSTLLTPAHVAIIMDGNGRWAEQRGRPRWMGHVAGARTVKDVVAHCAQRGVEQLTLYAFSADNWNRPVQEVGALLELFESHFRTQMDTLAEKGIRLSVIGRRTKLPLSLRRAIREAERRTAAGRRMHLRVALDYSARPSRTRSPRAPRCAASRAARRSCRRWTCSCAREGSAGSATSCSGSAPTPSCSSSTSSGRT
jgi:undecaprenyl diphosphate synthase